MTLTLEWYRDAYDRKCMQLDAAEAAIPLSACQGCTMAAQIPGNRVRAVIRTDDSVGLFCERCLTHSHLRNCRVCNVDLPVEEPNVVYGRGADAGYLYCLDHNPDVVAS